MSDKRQSNGPIPREGYAPVGDATLYYREIGYGLPVMVLHGGPEYNHTYLLPDMDRLAEGYRLINYDQRGRGRSAPETQPADVTMSTDVADLDALRAFFGLESVAVLGHSWGGLLAMAYAIAHPERVSDLILMNTAPASHEDFLMLRKELAARRAPIQDRFDALLASAAYQAGDPDAAAEYCRLHFGTTITQPDALDRVVRQLRASFTQEIVVRGRAIEDRLYDDTWRRSDFDLTPDLRRLSMPTLVLHSESDFIPAECAAHIVQAIPGARLAMLPDCGHFAYMEAPEAVRRELTAFIPPGE